jgi:AI-2 transport protein TqsA
MPMTMPAFVPRGLIILMGAASAVIVVAGMMAASWLIGPVLLALVIVILVRPVQDWARRQGWPGWLSTLLLLVVIYAVILSLAWVLVASVGQLVALLPAYTQQWEELLAVVTEALRSAGLDPSAARATAGSLDLSALTGLFTGLVSQVTSVLSGVVLLLALLFFLAAESAGMPGRMAAIAEERVPVVDALRGFAGGVRRYLIVTTVFGLIVAVFDTVALAILGVPLALLWGLLAFITNYIPNVGFVIGLVPPALLALLSGGWASAVWVIAIYSVLNFVIQSLIQPKFVGNSVGLSAFVTFVALIFWAWVLGGLGALLAIPVTLLIKALLVDADPRARWVDALIRPA